MNEISLVSSRKYPGFCTYKMPDALIFWCRPDVLGIDGDWYAPGSAHLKYSPDCKDPEECAPIINTHSAWTLRPKAL